MTWTVNSSVFFRTEYISLFRLFVSLYSISTDFSEKQQISFHEAFRVVETSWADKKITVNSKFKLNNDVSGRAIMIPTVQGRLIYVNGESEACHGEFKFVVPRPDVEGAQLSNNRKYICSFLLLLVSYYY